MADETRIITVKRGPSDEWQNEITPLEAGEIGYDQTTDTYKGGNGTTSFGQLPAFLTENNVADAIPDANSTQKGVARFATAEEVGEGTLDNVMLSLQQVRDMVQSAIAGGIPRGLISMWSGALSDIPTGWALCDGQDGRPDFTDKFIKGISTVETEPGETGGENSRTLEIANMPAHAHAISELSTNTTGAHAHDAKGESGGIFRFATVHNDYQHSNRVVYGTSGVWTAGESGNEITGGPHYPLSTASTGNHEHTISGSLGSAGSGTPFDNRPAYFELAFIIKQ